MATNDENQLSEHEISRNETSSITLGLFNGVEYEMWTEELNIAGDASLEPSAVIDDVSKKIESEDVDDESINEAPLSGMWMIKESEGVESKIDVGKKIVSEVVNGMSLIRKPEGIESKIEVGKKIVSGVVDGMRWIKKSEGIESTIHSSKKIVSEDVDYESINEAPVCGMRLIKSEGIEGKIDVGKKIVSEVVDGMRLIKNSEGIESKIDVGKKIVSGVVDGMKWIKKSEGVESTIDSSEKIVSQDVHYESVKEAPVCDMRFIVKSDGIESKIDARETIVSEDLDYELINEAPVCGMRLIKESEGIESKIEVGKKIVSDVVDGIRWIKKSEGLESKIDAGKKVVSEVVGGMRLIKKSEGIESKIDIGKKIVSDDVDYESINEAPVCDRRLIRKSNGIESKIDLSKKIVSEDVDYESINEADVGKKIVSEVVDGMRLIRKSEGIESKIGVGKKIVSEVVDSMRLIKKSGGIESKVNVSKTIVSEDVDYESINECDTRLIKKSERFESKIDLSKKTVSKDPDYESTNGALVCGKKLIKESEAIESKIDVSKQTVSEDLDHESANEALVCGKRFNRESEAIESIIDVSKKTVSEDQDYESANEALVCRKRFNKESEAIESKIDVSKKLVSEVVDYESINEARERRLMTESKGIESEIVFGKATSTEISGVIEEDGAVDYDVEMVLAKQNTHDLFCPNCHSCITRRVILQRRKRKFRFQQRKNKQLTSESFNSRTSVISSPDNVAAQENYHDDNANLFRCLSCFTFFIPSGTVFEFFGDSKLKRTNQNENSDSLNVTAHDKGRSASSDYEFQESRKFDNGVQEIEQAGTKQSIEASSAACNEKDELHKTSKSSTKSSKRQEGSFFSEIGNGISKIKYFLSGSDRESIVDSSSVQVSSNSYATNKEKLYFLDAGKKELIIESEFKDSSYHDSNNKREEISKIDEAMKGLSTQGREKVMEFFNILIQSSKYGTLEDEHALLLDGERKKTTVGKSLWNKSKTLLSAQQETSVSSVTRKDLINIEDVVQYLSTSGNEKDVGSSNLSVSPRKYESKAHEESHSRSMQEDIHINSKNDKSIGIDKSDHASDSESETDDGSSITDANEVHSIPGDEKAIDSSQSRSSSEKETKIFTAVCEPIIFVDEEGTRKQVTITPGCEDVSFPNKMLTDASKNNETKISSSGRKEIINSKFRASSEQETKIFTAVDEKKTFLDEERAKKEISKRSEDEDVFFQSEILTGALMNNETKTSSSRRKEAINSSKYHASSEKETKIFTAVGEPIIFIDEEGTRKQVNIRSGCEDVFFASEIITGTSKNNETKISSSGKTEVINSSEFRASSEEETKIFTAVDEQKVLFDEERTKKQITKRSDDEDISFPILTDAPKNNETKVSSSGRKKVINFSGLKKVFRKSREQKQVTGNVSEDFGSAHHINLVNEIRKGVVKIEDVIKIISTSKNTESIEDVIKIISTPKTTESIDSSNLQDSSADAKRIKKRMSESSSDSEESLKSPSSKPANSDEIQPHKGSTKSITIPISHQSRAHEYNQSSETLVIDVESATINAKRTAKNEISHEISLITCIVYGGLVEAMTSLGVVSSAAGARASTASTFGLGLANLIGGFFILCHNLLDLKHDRTSEDSEQESSHSRYMVLKALRKNFVLYAAVIAVSYVAFGALPPVLFGFSFYKSDDRDFKYLAVAVASVVCIGSLAAGKSYANGKGSYFKTIIYFVVLAFGTSGSSFVIGDIFFRFLQHFGWPNDPPRQFLASHLTLNDRTTTNLWKF